MRSKVFVAGTYELWVPYKGSLEEAPNNRDMSINLDQVVRIVAGTRGRNTMVLSNGDQVNYTKDEPLPWSERD